MSERKHLIVIVCGGRNYSDRDRVFRELGALQGEVNDDNPLGAIDLTILHGNCHTGADRWADEYAIVNWTGLRTFPADWSRWGRAAGLVRNEEMAKAGADLCLAFPGGSGTADMVGRARRNGIKVKEIVA